MDYKYEPNQVGAVITFPEGMTPQEVSKALAKVSEIAETVQIHEYDNDYGGPVWYVP